MDTYLKKIVDDNDKIFKDIKNISKINVGFTNSVYSADDKYIIKICNNKENEANNYKEKYLLQQQEKLSTLIQKKEKSEKKLDYICSLLKFIFVFLVLIIFVKTAMILEWDNTTQKIIWIVSVSLTILSYFYGNKIEFIKEMTLKFRKIIQSGLYKYYGFKEEIYKTLEVEIKSILDSQK